MKESSKPNSEDKKKKATYKFKSERLFLNDSLYFNKLQNSYEKSKQAKNKVEPERQAIKNHIRKVKRQLQKSVSNKDKALFSQDLAFFQQCLSSLKVIDGMIDKGLAVAKKILETRVKQSYALLVDFQRVPCPSERALDKNKSKAKNGDNKQADNEQSKNSGEKTGLGKSAKLDLKKLNEMRGLSPNTVSAPLKGEEVSAPVSEVAADKNADNQSKDNAVVSKGKRKKTLLDYKKEYGFTRTVQRRGKQHSVQNLNILKAGRDTGR